jgi:hypothetical protein
MARYLMHLRDSVDTMLDPEGQDFESIEDLRDAVLLNVRSLVAADIADGILDLRFRIEAEDENGKVVYRLPFKHAINIIPEEAWGSERRRLLRAQIEWRAGNSTICSTSDDAGLEEPVEVLWPSRTLPRLRSNSSSTVAR